MKRLLSLLLIATILCGLFAGITVAAETTGTTVYLKPNSNWLKDGARFAAYFFGNGEEWLNCTDPDGDGIYEVQVPAGYTQMIFCRMNPSTTANNWNNKWNQTADLTVPADEKVLCVINDGTWDKSSYWAILSGSNPEPTDPPVTEPSYYVAGTTDLCGSFWSEKDAANKMTPKGNGIYEKVYDEVPGGTHKFKVTDGTWNNSWGDNGSDYVIEFAIASKVTITFNSNTKAITVSTEEIEGGVAATEPDCYYVAGTAGLCGSEWQCADEANKMTLNSDGLYEMVYQNVPAGDHEFKVTDGTWNNSWGKDGGSDNYAINLPAVSNVTITFNSQTKAITVDIACQHKNTKIEGGFPATCGKVGSTGTTICVDCEKILKDAEEIPALDHKPAEKWTSDATNHWHICENGCGELLEESKHTYANGACTSCGHSCSHNFKDGACTICNLPCEHNYENSVCTVCGLGCTHEYVDGVCKHCKISCNHSYKDGKCETCGIECTHTTELQGAKDATCTEAGHEGNLVCTICNKVVKQGNEIPALNHKNTETRVEGAKDATCGVAGHTGKTICECGETISEGEEIPATGNHNYVDGACSVCGGKDPNYVAPANRILYVKPSSEWLTDSPRFAAYFFNDDGNTWVDCTASSVDGVWQVEIPADFADGKVIFCRMNPSATENSWDNKWNQTSDLLIPAEDDEKTCYHVVAWDNGAGQWTKLGDEPGEVKVIYFVKGNMNGDANWDKAYEMTPNADGTVWTVALELTAGSYEYKINSNTGYWSPNPNCTLVLTEDAVVTFTFVVEGEKVSHEIRENEEDDPTETKPVEPEDTTPETTAPEDTTPETTAPESKPTEPETTEPEGDGTRILYVKPNAGWLESEARFAAYFFNDDGNTWVDCTASSVDGVWQVEIPADFADGQVIFCRMNPATNENNWDNKWNQTADLPIPAANDNKTCYHVVGWDNGAGQWTKLGDEPEAAKTIYYVAGSFGTEGWNKHHQMTESADGATWSLSMDLKAGTYEYKVKDNGTGWWPEANVQLVLEQDATVEFTIDVATKAVTHKITPKTVDPDATEPKPTEPEATEPKPTTPDNPDTIVVYAQVPESWTDVGVYIWDASGKYDAAWPGIQMTKGADGWYTAEVPAWAENIIINNNGNGAQTQDMAITVGRDLWIVVEAAESGFVGTVSYESAKTGDSTNLIALSVAMLLAAAGMVTLVVKKKEF